MEIVNYVLLSFAAVAALDRIFGSRLGLGKDFEKGIGMAGTLVLAMAGMLVLCPVISDMLMGISGASSRFFDFSIIPAVLLANDMGASQIAMGLAASSEVGYLNGMVVSSMMGCTVSFLVPYVLQVTNKKLHNDIIFGLLCGIITIPVGVAVAGLILGVDIVSLVFVLLPLLAFAAVVGVGIMKFERATVRIFIAVGWIIKAIITFGLFVGIVHFVTGFEIIPGIDSLGNVMKTLTSIICVMVGAFPLISVLERLLKKPLSLMGRGLGVNETSAFCMLVTLGTSVTTFEMASKMDRRGLVMNSAFAVSASFMFIDHLAWTMSVAPDCTLTVIVGKFVSAICAVAFAYFVCKSRGIGSEDSGMAEAESAQTSVK